MSAALLALLIFGLFFVLLHSRHGGMGGCGGGHTHGRVPRQEDAGATAGGPHDHAATPAVSEGGATTPPAFGGHLGKVLVLILLFLLPMMLFHYWAQAHGPLSPLLFWLFLSLPLVLFCLLGRPEEAQRQVLAEEQAEAEQGEQGLEQQAELIAQLKALAAADFAIQTTRYEADQIVFEGVVRGDAQHAYDALARKFATVERTPLLVEGDRGRTLLIARPQTATVASAASARPVWNLLLFLATLVTTTWAGAMHQGVNLVQEPGLFAVGLPYALPLLAILGIHELGHYVMAHYHGIKVTLPYFIPVPFGLGTFGAFIHLQSTPQERRSLFDVAVAGPLTGFKHDPALNEVIALTPGRRLLGAFAFLLLVVIMAPVPHQFMKVLGLACPYI